MRAAIRLIGIGVVVGALSPLAAAAAELPTPPAAVGSAKAAPNPKPAQDPNADCVGVYGAKFFALGDTGFCGKAGVDVMGFLAKDFANTDISLVGQRLPSVQYAAGVPILFYYAKNFADQTANPYPGVDAQVNFMAARQTEAGPLVTFVNLRAAGQLQQDGGADMAYAPSNAVDGSALRGLVDQAWVRLGGLEAGIQPSMFGFARWGYSITPGYSSLTNTPAISYTYRWSDVFSTGDAASVSVAVEDPTRRDMADGVLANYTAAREPDYVVQARYATPTLLLHASAALHQISDQAAFDCCDSPTSKAMGEAATLGAEYRFKWSDIFAAAPPDMYGKLMFQGAAARGAIGYLGIPFFATDYVADGDGNLKPTIGFSGIASYEHLWTPTLKSSLTYSYFQTSETSGAEPLTPISLMWFDVKMRGSLLQTGIEDMLQPGLMVGAEAGYTWTTATGSYAGAASAPLSVGFPNIAAYVRVSF